MCFFSIAWCIYKQFEVTILGDPFLYKGKEINGPIDISLGTLESHISQVIINGLKDISLCTLEFLINQVKVWVGVYFIYQQLEHG